MDTGILLDVEDRDGCPITPLILADVFRPGLMVALPLVNDTMEDARVFVGLRRSLCLKDFLE